MNAIVDQNPVDSLAAGYRSMSMAACRDAMRDWDWEISDLWLLFAK